MSYEQRDNTGSLFSNKDKKEPGSNSPDYSGTCVIGGVEHFFDGWLKTTKEGKKWMSFSFKPKRAAAQGSRRTAEPRDEEPPF